MSEINYDAPLLPMAQAAFTDNRANRIVEDLRKKIAAAGIGITVIGNAMTLRFSTTESPSVKCVTMFVTDVTDDAVRDLTFLEDGQ